MKHYLALDVGGTKIMAGLVDENGQVLASQKYPMVRTDRDNAVNTVLDAAENFQRQIGCNYKKRCNRPTGNARCANDGA